MGTTSKGKYKISFCKQLTKKDADGKQEKIEVPSPQHRTTGAFGKRRR